MCRTVTGATIVHLPISSAQCDLCDQPIAAHQVEYEINDARAAKVIELRQNPPRGRGVCSGTGAVSP